MQGGHGPAAQRGEEVFSIDSGQRFIHMDQRDTKEKRRDFHNVKSINYTFKELKVRSMAINIFKKKTHDRNS